MHSADLLLWILNRLHAFCQAHKDGVLQQLLESGDNEAYEYDLIVIGGGSGGLACSKVKLFFNRAEQLLVEKLSKS